MKHTQGKAEIGTQSDYQNAVIVNGQAVCFIPKLSPNSNANASLIAETFNISAETGYTPAELAARLKEVEEQNNTGANQYALAVAEASKLVEQNKELVEHLERILQYTQISLGSARFVTSAARIQEIQDTLNKCKAEKEHKRQ